MGDEPESKPPRGASRGPEARRPIDDDGARIRGSTWFAIVVAAGVGALVLWRAFIAPAPHVDAPEAAPSASAFAALDAGAVVEPRCVDVAREALVIGDPPKVAPNSDAGDDANEEDDQPLAPFAVEIGHGCAFDGGFAAGALRDGEGGTISFVATVDAEGKNGKLVRLERSRGDMDPPIVAAAGKSVLAALIEPNAGGRSIRIARVTGDEVLWGPELKQGRDDATFDLASSGDRGVLVWDAAPDEEKRSEIVMISVDVATMKSVTKARSITDAKVDASGPKLVARPGGYWLAYAARAVETAKPKDPKKDPTKPRADEEEDVDTHDDDQAQWIEVMPLDETGARAGAAKAVSSKSGHLSGFDIVGADDGVIVAWRDDDLASGAGGGGRLFTALVRAGGSIEAHEVAQESASPGIPDLLRGFLAIGSLTNKTRFAAMSPAGEVLGALEVDPLVGGGQPLAARDGTILVAEPAGRAMRLHLVRCASTAIDPRP